MSLFNRFAAYGQMLIGGFSQDEFVSEFAGDFVDEFALMEIMFVANSLGELKLTT